jgi:hypothetical protein
MARLLADEAFPRPVMIELQRLGHDIIGLEETGRLSRWSLDDEVLRVVISSKRALLTLDRGFVSLLGERAQHPGMIVCAFDLDFIGLAQRIDRTLSTIKQLDGQIIRISGRRTVST